MRRVKRLFKYPVKSCRGVEVEAATLDEKGFEGDRQWMVVDEEGRFLTQRDHPELARVVPLVTEEGLTLSLADDPSTCTIVPHHLWTHAAPIEVAVWKHRGPGIPQGQRANDFFSTFLHRKVTLVGVPNNHDRIPNRRPEGNQMSVGFADACSLLVVAEASLAELNHHVIGEEIPVERFRANVVVGDDGDPSDEPLDPPWDEDSWKQVMLGEVDCEGVKLCTRCDITLLDHLTGRKVSKEPLATLARIHRFENKTVFGKYLIHRRLGTVRVGDRVTVVRGALPEL